MARTRRSEYQKSNRHRTLLLSDPDAVRVAARRLLTARDAQTRQRLGAELLARLASSTGVSAPELVVPDAQQPHQREGGRIVYSVQGEYRRRSPSPDDPRVARGGKPRGRMRILNRTPARGDIVRSSAFLNTLLHEFCHHHDAEALGLENSFHTSGFYARIRHLREQIGAEPVARAPRARVRRGVGGGVSARPVPRGRISPAFARLWAIIRDL